MSARNNNGTNWSLVAAGAAVVMTLVSNIWSLADPRNDIKDVRNSVRELKIEEIKTLREDIVKLREELRSELRWNYNTKDENKTYREGLERIIGRIEVKANTLDAEIHSVGFKDSIAQLHSRLNDLERSLRDKKPEVQIGPNVSPR